MRFCNLLQCFAKTAMLGFLHGAMFSGFMQPKSQDGLCEKQK